MKEIYICEDGIIIVYRYIGKIRYVSHSFTATKVYHEKDSYFKVLCGLRKEQKVLKERLSDAPDKEVDG